MREKSLKLLSFFKQNGIKVIETSPFSLYDKEIDDLIDIRLFVSKNNLTKFFWKYGKDLATRGKYSYLYNPLDVEELEKYKVSPQERLLLRRKIGIRDNDFVIGKIGRANLWKWEDSIIDIVPSLLKEIPNLKVLVRAVPDIKINSIAKSGLSKHFICLNETVNEKEIAETYQCMDAMVHTSRIGESFGVSLAEGMYFGLPIITKSTDFTKRTIYERDNAQIEIVKDGLNGFIENNSFGIQDKIIRLNNNRDELKSISKRNEEYAKETFGAELLTRELEGVIQFGITKEFVFEVEFGKYKNDVKDEGILDIMWLNTLAIWDKYVNKA